MVKDSIKNYKTYTCLNPRIKTALEYLANTNFADFKEATHELDEKNIYASMQKYSTSKPNYSMWETHKEYIDVQYIVSGKEDFGVKTVDNLTLATDYDEENDFSLWTGEGDFVSLNKGDFIILWSQDAHMPKRTLNEPVQVEKIVVKVKYNKEDDE